MLKERKIIVAKMGKPISLQMERERKKRKMEKRGLR